MTKTQPTPSEAHAAARLFAIDAARMAAATHCRDVAVLDVSGISPITDFLVIATGTSGRQMGSVCADIEEMGKPNGFKAIAQSGIEGDSWMVQDFVHVVVHIFSHTARQFYDLDNLWGDAKQVEWQEAGKASR